MKISSNSINWYSVIEKAINWKSIKPLYYTLYLSKEILNIQIPKNIFKQFKPSEIERKLFDFSISKTGWWYGRIETSNRAFLFPLRLITIDGIREKIKFLRDSLKLITDQGTKVE